MSKHLEIFGKGITVNPADIAWHWLDQVLARRPQEPVGQMPVILEHLANRELVQAEDKLKLYLFDNPDCVHGRLAAAAVCLYSDEPERAIEQLQSVYYRQPSNTMGLFLLGYCCERLGKTDQAMEYYQDCIKFKSHLQLPLQRMAAIYLSQGRIDKVIGEYEQLLAEHPDDIPSHVLCGGLYLAAGRYDKAIDTFNLSILSHPDNFNEVQQEDEIDTLAKSGMHEEAIERIQALIDQVGPMTDLIIRMADVYSGAGREAEAIACYEYTIRMQPSSLEAAIKLGTHYLRSRRFSLAAEQFNRAADINDEIVDAYLGLAAAQHLSGQTSEALQTMALASSIHQNSTLLYSESATLQFQSVMDEQSSPDGEKVIVLIDDVIAAYRKQLNECSGRYDVQYKYAILMMVENNLPLAISSLQNTLDLNDTHYRARHKLAICTFDYGQPEKAMDILVAPQPVTAAAYAMYYRTSILYCSRKNFAGAVKKLNRIKAAELFDQSDLRVNIELILENLGMIDRTFTNWRRLEETSECLLQLKDKGKLSAQVFLNEPFTGDESPD
ncbi:MAG: tetratricopeptide repeat protein [Planctomycetaceae bacterium]|nr:tetratricopeptide repeat protein [Planctomycetaceae bacterium]